MTTSGVAGGTTGITSASDDEREWGVAAASMLVRSRLFRKATAASTRSFSSSDVTPRVRCKVPTGRIAFGGKGVLLLGSSLPTVVATEVSSLGGEEVFASIGVVLDCVGTPSSSGICLPTELSCCRFAVARLDGEAEGVTLQGSELAHS